MLAQRKSTWRAFPPALAREDCGICQGTGWELMPSPGSARARRCACIALARAVRLREQVRIPKRYEQCTLESYQPRTLSQTHALAEAWRFAERFPQVERGLIFVGGHGVGKTHLAVGIALELIQRFQEDMLFVDFAGLPGVRWSLGNRAGPGDTCATRLRQVSLLVLDNIGVRPASVNQYQAALQLIQARLRTKKPTVCTSARLENLEASLEGGMPDGGKSPSSQSAIPQVHALFWGGFKIVRITGSDFNRMSSDNSSLF